MREPPAKNQFPEIAVVGYEDTVFLSGNPENFDIGEAALEIADQSEDHMLTLGNVGFEPAVSAFVKQKSHVAARAGYLVPPCTSG